MKIIFLDFDGVLNSERFVKNCDHSVIVPLDPSRMELLKEIVEKTGAEIVLSTTWREHWSTVAAECDEIGDYINDTFNTYGLKIYDKTPLLQGYQRAEEIGQWLSACENIKSFVVLDDDFMDAPFLRGHYIKTSRFKKGLDETNVQEAIDILNCL